MNVDEIIKKSENVKGYNNCRTFVQTVLGVSNIEQLPKTKELKPGNILWWGIGNQYTHVAIYLGNDEVYEVEEWGGKPRRRKIDKTFRTQDKWDKIFDPSKAEEMNNLRYTGTQMRKELQFVMEALRVQEQFVKESDPTMVVGRVLEKVGIHLSGLQALYNSKSFDRNQIVSESLGHIKDMIEILQDAESSLSSPSSPEDNDRSI